MLTGNGLEKYVFNKTTKNIESKRRSNCLLILDVLLSFNVGLQSSCLNVVFIDETNTPVFYLIIIRISQ